MEGQKHQWKTPGAKCAQPKSNRSKERPKRNGCRQRKGRRQDLLCVRKVGPHGQKLLGKIEEGEGIETPQESGAINQISPIQLRE